MESDKEKQTHQLRNKAINPEYWERLHTKIMKERVKVFLLVDKKGVILLSFLADNNEVGAINWDYIFEKEWRVIVSELSYSSWANNKRKRIITRDFWTCDCSRDYIKHKVNPYCKHCQTHFTKSLERAKRIDQMFDWWLPGGC